MPSWGQGARLPRGFREGRRWESLWPPPAQPSQGHVSRPARSSSDSMSAVSHDYRRPGVSEQVASCYNHLKSLTGQPVVRCQKLWEEECSGNAQTAPVGERPPRGWGLHSQPTLSYPVSFNLFPNFSLSKVLTVVIFISTFVLQTSR